MMRGAAVMVFLLLLCGCATHRTAAERPRASSVQSVITLCFFSRCYPAPAPCAADRAQE